MCEPLYIYVGPIPKILRLFFLLLLHHDFTLSTILAARNACFSSCPRAYPVLCCYCIASIRTSQSDSFLLVVLTHRYQVCVSSPTWEKISFLDVTANGQTTHFGVFGFTGSKVAIGYTFAPDRLGFR